MPRNAELGVDSLVLSLRTLRTMLDTQAAEGLGAIYTLRLGEVRFRAEVADGRFEVARGEADRPEGVIEADPATLGELVYGGSPSPKPCVRGPETRGQQAGSGALP
jgi:hypothetical protein